MIIGREIKFDIPIESYSKQLIFYLHYYLDKLQYDAKNYSEKGNEKAKIYLRWIVFPNKKEFASDFEKVEDDIHEKTWNVVNNYTTCIMQLLGRIAECAIIDKCSRDSEFNKICINLAKFKPNIYHDYNDIEYDKYVAFSPSFKYIMFIDEDGFLKQYNVPDYNPQHPTKDIAWCRKDNILSQLKCEIPSYQYLENAKLQIKTSLNYKNVNLNHYQSTPIVYFDLLGDCKQIIKKYPRNIICSARDIDEDIFAEVNKYFKILAAYATNLIDHVDINDFNINEDYRLAELFRTPIKSIINDTNLDMTGVYELIEEFRKPIIIEG